mmetsp:Transcript_2631/g.7833  ORF Transcript_2631/g.7833 Transcript_2631/m.7833 type:complete len:225 (+) Transcript_2631:356-1030(+)
MLPRAPQPRLVDQLVRRQPRCTTTAGPRSRSRGAPSSAGAALARRATRAPARSRAASPPHRSELGGLLARWSKALLRWRHAREPRRTPARARASRNALQQQATLPLQLMPGSTNTVLAGCRCQAGRRQARRRTPTSHLASSSSGKRRLIPRSERRARARPLPAGERRPEHLATGHQSGRQSKAAGEHARQPCQPGAPAAGMLSTCSSYGQRHPRRAGHPARPPR